MAEDTASRTGGSIWTRRYGPLPVWAYALILLAAVAAWRVYAMDKQAKSGQQDQAAPQLIGGNQNPPIVFQDYPTTLTYVNLPPGGGREHPPGPAPPPPPAPAPVPAAPPPRQDPPAGPVSPPPRNPAPAPAPTPPRNPAPAPASGQWVTVAKWTSSNTAWNSTLWGMAQRLLGNGNSWTRIWNDPSNAPLKARRKDPKLIQPGDRVFVPAK